MALAASGVPVGGVSEGLDGELIQAVVFVRNSSRARRVLEYLARRGREATKPLLVATLGRVGRKDHALLNELMALGLIKRYSGHNEDGHFVVWNEITPRGRLVLELVEAVEREG